MGRPKGEARGSKARPSSSSQAASLAQSAGAVNVGFGGYVGSSRIDSGLAGEEACLNIDGESAANLRRLAKKDTTTKLKALSALATSFQELPARELAPIVPVWVFEYKRLVHDNSRQIREVANKALANLASSIGKSIAPHLKALMGPLWVAHFDPFSEVSESARQAFQSVFPEQKKRLEALAFCAPDIFTHIDENLKLTPQTISVKNTPLDESTEKYERAIASSLLALAALIEVLLNSSGNSERDIATKQAAIKTFQDHRQFQAFFKSSSSRVRSAVYDLTRTYIQHVPEAFTEQNMDAVVKSVLGAFGEKDPACHQGMWDMVLRFSQRFPQAWEGPACRKVFLPKLWAFLRHGCFGSQRNSYPCILPLVSLIPPASLAPSEDFFNELFTSLWKGCEGGVWTNEDGLLLLNTLEECLRWVISNAHRYNTEAKSTLQASVIDTVVLKLLFRKYLLGSTTKLIASSLNSNKFIEAVKDCIFNIIKSLDDYLLSNFWTLLRDECLLHLRQNESGESVSHITELLMLLSRWRKDDVLDGVVKPLVAEVFPDVKESPQAEKINLLSRLVSNYGPEAFLSLASSNWAGKTDDARAEGPENLSETFALKHLEYFFRKEVLPWCLEENADDKHELLLSFLQDALFFKQWNFVLNFISELHEGSKRTKILATLIAGLQRQCLMEDKGNNLLKWRSPKIDEAVLASVGELPDYSAYNLVRSCLTGIVQDGSCSLVISDQTVLTLLEELSALIALPAVLSDNHFSEFLISSFRSESSEKACTAQLQTYATARSAIDIVLSGHTWVQGVERCSSVLSKIFATIFCLYWAYMGKVIPASETLEDHDNDSEPADMLTMVSGGSQEEADFVVFLTEVHRKLVSLFPDIKWWAGMQELLILAVKKAVLEAEDNDIHIPAAMWVLDLLKFADGKQSQTILDRLLSPSKCWPLYAEGANAIESKRHDVFVSMVHKVGLSIGLDSLVSETDQRYFRSWLIIELLCTWKWSSGTAKEFVLPYLQTCSTALADQVLQALFVKLKNGADALDLRLYTCWRRNLDHLDVVSRSLLSVLEVLFSDDRRSSKAESEKIFKEYLSSSSGFDSPLPLYILPCVLDNIMPSIQKRPSTEVVVPDADIESTICEWIKATLSIPVSSLTAKVQWMQVAASCFPVDPNGGDTALLRASGAEVSDSEKHYLLLLVEQSTAEAASEQGGHITQQLMQVAQARLVAAAVCYCWRSLGIEEWKRVLAQLRKWLQAGVLEAEELAETAADVNTNVLFPDQLSSDLRQELLAVSMNILSLIKSLHSLYDVNEVRSLQDLAEAQWQNFEARATENVLRLLLATGLAESFGDAAKREVALYRLRHSQLWDQVALISLAAPDRIREAAVRAADLWGLGKGSITALYSILFSPHPLASLQWIAYKFLSSDPLQHQSVTWKVAGAASTEDDQTVAEAEDVSDALRPELRIVLEMPSMELLSSPISSTQRVRFFLAWSLLLSHLQTLPTSSQAKQRLLQYVQDSDIPGTLLDCLFQHIVLKRVAGGAASRKKESVIEATAVADAAKRSSETGSVSFAVEGLWGGGEDEIALLAGALYGLLLRVIPACVRTWFTGLRDRGTAAAIELFTTLYCSPALLDQEFAQVQAAAVGDENLVIKANKTLQEVTASYKKEETGMDIVIKLPSCYPLKAVELDCTRLRGINETRLRKWTLSMATFLRNQNGAVAQAVIIWKRNVDREFEGVEECPICYSIIHTSDHSLPRLACKTCRHKFHSACLYKWFSSSHKSTCPLCQTPF